MASLSSSYVLLFSLLLMVSTICDANNFYEDFDIIWGDQRVKIVNGGQLASLSIDESSGSGFRSKREYLFGRIDMELKIVPGDSSGLITTYYLSSIGDNHDEIDFEFLGVPTGQPYTLHTNVFSQGKGGREQQFHLWFDPTRNFHTYSIVWNPLRIVFLVDGIPIREFGNAESKGVPFPKNQPMKLYSTLWHSDDSWATRRGVLRTDWSKGPFTSYYRNFKNSTADAKWASPVLDPTDENKLRWVRKNFMLYNYCTDRARFPQGIPPECILRKHLQTPGRQSQRQRQRQRQGRRTGGHHNKGEGHHQGGGGGHHRPRII